jgi:DNA repair protein RecN (Recombination protein N)
VRDAHAAWHAADRERASFEQRARDRDNRLDLLRHYVAELDALDPKAQEAEALVEERRRIASLGRLAEGTAQVEALLAADEGGIATALARAQTALRQLVRLDAQLAPTERLVDEASIATREALGTLRHYVDAIDADPARQEWVEARLAALEGVARKHREEIGELPTLRERLRTELDDLEAGAVSRAELTRRLALAREDYLAAAQRLGAGRRTAAHSLDGRVTALMQGLGMPGGVFRTRVDAHEPPEFSASGNDDVEFLVSANPGQPPRPLARVASGGELSRISLALQVAALEAEHLPCLVFDEVDAGVGGAVAEMVGRQLRELAAGGQVLCVTHLPQVATQSDHQLKVSKQTGAGTTRIRIEPLDQDGRVEEIARMLGGTTITDRTREHAREMLDAAGGTAPADAAAPAGGASRASPGKGSSRARSGRAGSASGR